MATDAGLRLSAVLVAIANILVPLSIVTFGIGFFPYKPVLPGLAEYEPLESGEPPRAPFDRLVFMVVDALRRYVCDDSMPRKCTSLTALFFSDFVFSQDSGFEYTQR